MPETVNQDRINIKENRTGIYIHFPFCRNKCPYCGFYSLEGETWRYAYHEFLLCEIDKTAKLFKDLFPPVDTIYFGGGTPSLMPVFAIDETLTRLRLSLQAAVSWKELEITFEANPEDLDIDFLKTLHNLGINRLSIGAQRLDDIRLVNLGRCHNISDILSGFRNARKAGFENISLDFILAVPGDSLDSIKRELQALVELKPEHISVYLLEIKDKTPFARMDDGEFPDESLAAEMYLYTVKFLSEKGYKQYEISNFSLPGYKSQHNLKYWSGDTWLGLGPSAASHSGWARWTNLCDVQEYFNLVGSDDFRIPPLNAVTDRRNLAEEEFFMGMRRTTGLDLNSFKNKWGFNPIEGKEDLIYDSIESGLLIEEKTTGILRFTTNGFLVSNEILCRFIS